MVKLKEDLIREIVDLEWELFQRVPNQGGPAPCQRDRETFEIMRASQAASWSVAALESYLNDLKNARGDGRNLLTEKYARMMEFTAPEEYAAIAHLLPDLEPEALPIIDAIVERVMVWELSLADRYPYIFRRARPLFRERDHLRTTSVETYLRGELATFSAGTLRHLLANIEQQDARGINGSEITLIHMISAYGYTSLEEADSALRPRF